MKTSNYDLRVTKKRRSTRQCTEISCSSISSCYDLDYYYKDGTNKWLVVTLSEDTLLEGNQYLIEEEILSVFGNNTVYFIPMYKEKLGNREICMILFEGYIFVQVPADGLRHIDFNRLRTSYLKPPLHRGSRYTYVSNEDINNFKKELKKKIKSLIPKIGQKVIPKEGVFRDLEGIVKSIDRDRKVLIVSFEMSSRIVEAPVSFININLDTEIT